MKYNQYIVFVLMAMPVIAMGVSCDDQPEVRNCVKTEDPNAQPPKQVVDKKVVLPIAKPIQVQPAVKAHQAK